MSALWPDCIYVVISPSRVALVHTSGMPFGHKVISEKSVNLQSSEDKAIITSEIIKALSDMLSQPILQGAQLEILLTSHFVRMEVLPPLTQALKTEEQLRRTHLHFERIYGAIAKQWRFCSHTVAFQQPTLVAAMDQALLAGLQNVADTHKLKLISVEPGLMQMLKYWQKRLSGPKAKFIFVDQFCCSIVHLINNRIAFVSQLPCKNTLTPEELQTLLQREVISQGESLQGKDLYLFSPKNPSLSVVSSGVKLHQLRLEVTESTARFTRTRLLKLLGDA